LPKYRQANNYDSKGQFVYFITQISDRNVKSCTSEVPEPLGATTMTLYEARKYGGKEILKATAILFLLLELIFMFQQTNGDFANGILFFIEGQANIFFVLFLILCFITNYLLGTLAGAKIIVTKTNYLLVSILLGFTFSVLILLYHCSVVTVLMKVQHISNPFFSYSYLFNSLLKEFFTLIIPGTLCWIWAGHRMKQKIGNPKNSR
jgi:hypothetical protein